MMSRHSSLIAALCVALVSSLVTPQALASGGGGAGGDLGPVYCFGDGDGWGCAISSTTTYLGYTVAFVAITIVEAVSSSTSNKRSDALGPYVMANRVQLTQDLHLGAGETLHDLAAFYQVDASDRPDFYAYLHQTRALILELVEERTDEDRWQELHDHLLAHLMAS